MGFDFFKSALLQHPICMQKIQLKITITIFLLNNPCFEQLMKKKQPR